MTEKMCEGRVCIVTGAGRGIGREYALMLADQGAKVVINDFGGARDGTGADAGPAQQVVDEITAAGGAAVANTDNVASWEGAQRMVNTAIETFGDLHVLVNNAGILRDRMIFNMSEEEWDAVVRVHLNGHFAPLRHAAVYWRDEAKAGLVKMRFMRPFPEKELNEIAKHLKALGVFDRSVGFNSFGPVFTEVRGALGPLHLPITDHIAGLGGEAQIDDSPLLVPLDLYGQERGILDADTDLLHRRDQVVIAVIVMAKNRAEQLHQGLPADGSPHVEPLPVTADLHVELATIGGIPLVDRRKPPGRVARLVLEQSGNGHGVGTQPGGG